MSKTVAGTGLDDAIELVQTRDGWAWVDTGADGPTTEVVEDVEDVEYAVVPREREGVDQIQISELDSGEDDPKPVSGRMVVSSHWFDLDEMR